MPRTLYSILAYLVLPLIFLRLLWRSRTSPAYRERWKERLALYPEGTGSYGAVFFHAVSVGEVHAAQPLIASLRRSRPDLDIVVTCTTPTGSARIRQLFGDSVRHVYLPYDLPGAVERFLEHFSPRLLVLLETELWPNLLHACARHGCRVLLANARLSARSFENYRRHAELARRMLAGIDAVAAQAAADGERFVALGLPRERLSINGSLKFDVAVDAGKVEAAKRLKSRWQGRPVWIAASTREGEDARVLRAMQLALKERPDLLMVLVPRHPERFLEAAAMASALRLTAQRFSLGGDIAATTQVLVGDTMGDMYFYYALADLAFVGGSLVDTGCQNLIEPAALGLPVLSGPSLYNFQAVSDLLREREAMLVIEDEEALARELLKLFREPELASAMGGRALAVVSENRGATERLQGMILERL